MDKAGLENKQNKIGKNNVQESKRDLGCETDFQQMFIVVRLGADSDLAYSKESMESQREHCLK